MSTTAGSTVTTSGGCADEEPPAQGDFTPGAAVMIEFTSESPWDNWISLPYLVVYEDGSAVVYDSQRPSTAIPPSQVPMTTSSGTDQGARSQYGGLLPWAVGHVPRCELKQILADLAVVDPDHTDFGQPQVFDANGTSVTVHGVGGAAEAQYDAYALNEDFDKGLSEAAQQARQRLRAVMDRTEAAVRTVGILPVDRVELTSLASSRGYDQKPAWPLAASPRQLLAGKRCGEVRGGDAVKVAAAVPPIDDRWEGLYAGPWRIRAEEDAHLLVRVVPPGVKTCR